MTWTCWSTWEAPATALAAAEAAGMPVRRPRRPAAVSAADAAGAGPELGCAGQLERATEAPIDEASSLCVGSVGRSVGRSVGSGRDLYLVYPGLVAFAGVRSPRRVLLLNHGDRNLGVSALLRVSRSVCGGVGVFDVPGAGRLRGGSIPPLGGFESGFRGLAGSCCRWRSAGACLLSRAWHRRSACAVRAVFAFWLRRVL